MRSNDFKITAFAGGDRVDAFLCNQLPSVTRRLVHQAIKLGNIKVNNASAKAGQILQVGDVITGVIAKRAISARPEAGKELLPLDIVFEDECLIVVHKSRGLHCVTLLEDDPPTLADALSAYNACFLTASNDKREAGLVQRLDFFTSGLIIAAKSSEGWVRLHQAFSAGEVTKTYLAIVEGEFPETPKIVRSGLLSKGEMVQVVEENKAVGRSYSVKISSCMRTKVVKLKENVFSLVQVTAMGAHRHQVRAHLAYIGFPLVGDNLYGSNTKLSDLNILAEDGFLLHAAGIKLNHPMSGYPIEFSCQSDFINKF